VARGSLTGARIARAAGRAGRLTGALLVDVARGAKCRGVCGSASRPLGVRQRSPRCAPQRRHGLSSHPLAMCVIFAGGRDRLRVSMQRLPAGAPQFGHQRSIAIVLPSTAGGGGLRAGDMTRAVSHDRLTYRGEPGFPAVPGPAEPQLPGGPAFAFA